MNLLRFLLVGLLPASLIAAADATSDPKLVLLEKTLRVEASHLLVPVGNHAKPAGAKGDPYAATIGLFDGEKLVQSLTVTLPRGEDPGWLAAYPLEPFALKGRRLRVAPVGGRLPEVCRAAFEHIRVGAATEALSPADYAEPYRNQFHASSRRGWNNDPNGLVYHGGKYHLYYQHNPVGIDWGNMHWGHLESTDLLHWEEKPIALFQKTVKDMAFSGGGFIDFNNSSGLGKDTPFVAFTSTGRGECLAYSRDGGLTFTELPENPVVRHRGRDPKVFWHEPSRRWVMVVYDETACAETDAIPAAPGLEKFASRHLAFWESTDLRRWTRTGAFTDPDRMAVFECPELFELSVAGRPGQSRWILLAAENRYFIGRFDGRTFLRESGPLGTTHGVFYAAQTFSDVPDGRRIQIGWVRTDSFRQQFPDQVVNQSFTLPHELTLRETSGGLRVCFSPVKEAEKLRGEVIAEGRDLTVGQANALLQGCQGELTEVAIELSAEGGCDLTLNGIDAGFRGRSARIFTDRTFNEVYADDGLSYEVRKRTAADFGSTKTLLQATDGAEIRWLRIYRLMSIWRRE